jgi:hypothetical protein
LPAVVLPVVEVVLGVVTGGGAAAGVVDDRGGAAAGVVGAGGGAAAAELVGARGELLTVIQFTPVIQHVGVPSDV